MDAQLRPLHAEKDEALEQPCPGEEIHDWEVDEEEGEKKDSGVRKYRDKKGRLRVHASKQLKQSQLLDALIYSHLQNLVLKVYIQISLQTKEVPCEIRP